MSSALRKGNWLQVTEYAAIALSVIGSAVATFSQQPLYATAPISVSLVLNVLNRHRSEFLSRASLLPELHPFGELSGNFDNSPREAGYEGSVVTLPTENEETITVEEAIIQLYNAIAALDAEMQTRLSVLENLDIDPIREDICQLQDQHALLLTSLSHLKNEQNTVDETAIASTVDLSSLQTQIQQLSDHFNHFTQQVDLERLIKIQKITLHLHKQHRQTIVPHLSRLEMSIKKLQQQQQQFIHPETH